MTDIMDNTCTYTPLVSVIVPVYNAAQTLERCVEGILAQSFSDFELILVDDGSTDASGAICAAYSDADSRVVVVSQPNKGVSAARNAGLDRARARYVAYCDSDDTVKDYWLSSMVAVAEKAGMIVCGYNILRPGEHEWTQETLGHTEIFTDDDVLLETLLGKRLFQFIWNKLFKMSLIRESGLRFDESFTIFEDEYFVLGYIRLVHRVICIPECGYNYWCPPDFMKKYDFGIDAFRKVVELIYEIAGTSSGKLRLPSIVYWYKVALGRYALSHTFEATREHLEFARRLAVSFHDGALNHVMLRIFPLHAVYLILRWQAHRMK